VFRKMITHLIRGDWEPGERIPAERELCVKLGVGRASLREALKTLEIIGMIETRLGDGTYACDRAEFLSRPLLWAIASSSETETGELIEARSLIETELVGMAAERATAEELKYIGSFLDAMERTIGRTDEFLQADIGFHLAVGQAAHNRILSNALDLIRNLLQEWIGKTLQREGVAAQALAQHKQIFLAIAKQNAAEARLAMRSHLKAMAAVLVDSERTSELEMFQEATASRS
jgi:GntR family transcriptional repressor for pyruvate dehydrogenase complex